MRGFLQQQLGRLHHRYAVEAVPYLATEGRVGQGNQRHSLVVRHVRAHNGDVLRLRQPAGGEIERFIESVAAQTTGFGQALEVQHG